MVSTDQADSQCEKMQLHDLLQYYPKEEAKIYINSAEIELVQQTRFQGYHR